MANYKRGERIPRLGVYQFTLAEPDEDSELLPEESEDEDNPVVEIKKHCCSLKKVCLVLVIMVLVLVIIALCLLLTVGLMLPFKSQPVFPATPPMGWTSLPMAGDRCNTVAWNSISQAVQMLEMKGLRHKGYRYIVINGCWQDSRNGSGYLHPNKALGGFKGLVNHARWLRQEKFKIGLSTGVGTQTCWQQPGSFNHEEHDLEIFSQYWRVEYITADSCFLPPQSNQSTAYKALYDAIIKTKSKTILHMNATVPLSAVTASGHVRQVVPWRPLDEWGDMMAVVDQVVQDKLWLYAKPGFWNDLGPLTVGSGNRRQAEYDAQFALWCIFKSQLFLTKCCHIGRVTVELITNEYLLDINQDELGESAKLVYEANSTTVSNNFQVVAKPCRDEKNQLWNYSNITHQIVHEGTSKCLTHDGDSYLSVKTCTNNDKSMKWSVRGATEPGDQGDYHIVPYTKSQGKEECVTLSTHKGVAALVRLCSQRQSTRNWQGENQSWHGYNDAFQIAKQNNANQFKNKAGMCFAVGGSADKQIFAGKLSRKRHVVLLLNRAAHDDSIHLQFKHLNIDLNKHYTLQEVLTNTSHGPNKDSYEIIVPGRSVKVFIMYEMS